MDELEARIRVMEVKARKKRELKTWLMGALNAGCVTSILKVSNALFSQYIDFV